MIDGNRRLWLMQLILTKRNFSMLVFAMDIGHFGLPIWLKPWI